MYMFFLRLLEVKDSNQLKEGTGHVYGESEEGIVLHAAELLLYDILLGFTDKCHLLL